MLRALVPRRTLRGSQLQCLRLAASFQQPPIWPLSSYRRELHKGDRNRSTATENKAQVQSTEGWKNYETFFHYPSASKAQDFQVGNQVTVHGFLNRRRVQHAQLMFADITVPDGPPIQVVSTWQEEGSDPAARYQALKDVPLLSPVVVTGRITKMTAGTTTGFQPTKKFPVDVTRIDLDLIDIQELNVFPKDIIVSKGVQFPPSARHLQIRFSQALQNRLQFRDHINRTVRRTLQQLNFREYETPILFKSTPEGAREFLVPTRRRGFAYALPQSPQQFKQLLMASGVGNYYQFARCFRDEDLRADRQPEFTQLDLEMAFATGEDVMQAVESIIRSIYEAVRRDWNPALDGSEVYPCRRLPANGENPTGKRQATALHEFADLAVEFRRISYDEAMSTYGSDKPDLRIPNTIRRIDGIMPKHFTDKISGLTNPIVEACKFRLEGSPKDLRRFVAKIMGSLPLPARNNPDGEPVMLVFDSSQPLGGLSSLGHEGYSALTTEIPEFADLEDGDVLVMQARENKPLQGGGTALGSLRTSLYDAATEEGLLPRDNNFHFVWVTGFPMFTPNNDVDPGQGGKAGFSSTHHPFTAPLTATDFRLLATEPLKAKADHYDLVVNGVELGGGSRRIHVAAVQEYVMSEILQMPKEGIAQFAHLLEALRAGCPPHAGFALGFDRLVAVLSGTNSVRDVIAFPKSKKGEDLMVNSPGPVTEEQLRTYSLELRGRR